eukprot:Gb_29051 [translate_table: standard]
MTTVTVPKLPPPEPEKSKTDVIPVEGRCRSLAITPCFAEISSTLLSPLLFVFQNEILMPLHKGFHPNPYLNKNTETFHLKTISLLAPDLVAITCNKGTGSGSLISTTTTSDVRNVLATDAACSKQHLTTCFTANAQNAFTSPDAFHDATLNAFANAGLGAASQWYMAHSTNVLVGALGLVINKQHLPLPANSSELEIFIVWENKQRHLKVMPDINSIKAVMQMIMTVTAEQWQVALDKLLPYQQSDFEGIYRAMDGLPVTICHLDSPLHEFLPKEMQACTIFEVAIVMTNQGVKVLPEIMVPLVGTPQEPGHQVNLIHKVIERVFSETNTCLTYKIRTMIKTPQAALIGDDVAQHAEFFSFGCESVKIMTECDCKARPDLNTIFKNNPPLQYRKGTKGTVHRKHTFLNPQNPNGAYEGKKAPLRHPWLIHAVGKSVSASKEWLIAYGIILPDAIMTRVFVAGSLAENMGSISLYHTEERSVMHEDKSCSLHPVLYLSGGINLARGDIEADGMLSREHGLHISITQKKDLSCMRKVVHCTQTEIYLDATALYLSGGINFAGGEIEADDMLSRGHTQLHMIHRSFGYPEVLSREST